MLDFAVGFVCGAVFIIAFEVLIIVLSRAGA